MPDAVPDPQDAPSLNWGIIAPGGIANKLAEAVREFTAGTVVAVGSRDAGRAADFAERNGVAWSHGSYEDLVADDEVQAVYVASPHSGHREHALLAIEAGKHVLIEKALARNSSEVEDIFGAAQRNHVFAMEAMWTRHLPHIAEVRRRIAEGAIGEVVTVTADHGQALDLPNEHRLKDPCRWRAAGPRRLPHLVHHRPPRCAPGGVRRRTADGDRRRRPRGAGARYGPKTLAQLDTTLWTKTPTTAVISGTEGSIEIDGDFYGRT